MSISEPDAEVLYCDLEKYGSSLNYFEYATSINSDTDGLLIENTGENIVCLFEQLKSGRNTKT